MITSPQLIPTLRSRGLNPSVEVISLFQRSKYPFFNFQILEILNLSNSTSEVKHRIRGYESVLDDVRDCTMEELEVASEIYDAVTQQTEGAYLLCSRERQ